ncbi:MAG: PHP domain-containing protein [Phycisphaerae bacterium]
MSRNQEIAGLFSRAADVMALLEENSFRVLGTRKVARIIEDLPEDVETLQTQGRLEQTPGIGRNTVDKIGEFLRTGHISEFEELSARVPAGVLEMLAISSVGVKTAHQLWKEAGITTVAELKKHLTEGTMPQIKGLGEKKRLKIRQNMEFMEETGKRIGLGWALPLAESYCVVLATVAGVLHVQYCGSLRRGKETVGDIDILISAAMDAVPAITGTILAHEQTRQTLGAGDTKISIRTQTGLQVDFRIVAPQHWGAALQYFTGSKEHNVRVRELAAQKGLKLNEWGLFRDATMVAGEKEENIYEALELAWIPPEMREDRGEIELAALMFERRHGANIEASDPRLKFLIRDIPAVWPVLQISDIRGDLHSHTTASDGQCSIDDMIAEAKRRGYEYFAITDHSKSQVQANGLRVDRLMEHIKAIHAAAAKVKGLTVLAGSEVDILADGSLDYPDDVLQQLDWVVASPHSALSQESAAATARLIRAASHPCVDVLGHPTGRLVGERRGLEPDMKALVMAAARSGVALEINSHDLRLDLRDTHARLAVEAGVPLCINTDAHQREDMDKINYGILTARRAWARSDDIINTWPWEAIRRRQQSRRSGNYEG